MKLQSVIVPSLPAQHIALSSLHKRHNTKIVHNKFHGAGLTGLFLKTTNKAM